MITISINIEHDMANLQTVTAERAQSLGSAQEVQRFHRYTVI